VGNELRPRFRGYFVLLVVLGILLVGLASQRAIAQTEKASVSGRVTDQSNAAVPDAEVQIKNTDTGVADDLISTLARQKLALLGSAVSDARLLATGATIQARCLECPVVAARTPEPSLLDLLLAWKFR